MPNPERRAPEPVDYGKEAPKEAPKPVETPERTDVGERVKEREQAHARIQQIDAELPKTEGDTHARLKQEREQLVSRVMEINANLTAEGIEVPRQVDFDKPAEEVESKQVVEEATRKVESETRQEAPEKAPEPSMVVEGEEEGYALGELPSEEKEESYSMGETAAPDAEVLTNQELVAKELGVSPEGMDELKKRFEELNRAAAQDSAIRTALEGYGIDFTWDQFMNQAEEAEKGFWGKLKKSLFGAPTLRERRLDKLQQAYQDLVASGKAGRTQVSSKERTQYGSGASQGAKKE